MGIRGHSLLYIFCNHKDFAKLFINRGALAHQMTVFLQNLPLHRTFLHITEQKIFAPKVTNIPTKDLQMCVQDCLVSGCGELGAVVQLPNLVATGQAFAMWWRGGRATAWGDPIHGGDSTKVQDQLRNVHQIQASNEAFAAVISDGRVVTWGNPDLGGDCAAVQDQLRNVSQIQASDFAFAAITSDGQVVTWGHPNRGGDSAAVQEQLLNISQIQASKCAFAAITLDGRVVTWGDPDYGGDSTAVQDQLRDVSQIQASDCAFTINPLLGQKCLRFLGCPQQILSALDMVWNQRRWLCFQDECLPEPQLVSSSVPQGDAISPLTLLALMTGLTGKVLQHEQVPHTLVTYLDDRNFVVKQPEDAAQIWKTWTEMSGKVGLWENADKVKVVPRKGCFRNRLLASGFEESHIANSARVLGVDFTARLGAVDRPTQKQRLQEAGVRIARIDLLPLPADSKASLVSSLAIPKAIWGAWTSVIPGKPLNQCIKKAAGGGHVSASSNLFYLLAGHGLSLHFCGGFAAYLNLADLVRRHPRAWPARSPRGTWLGTVRKWLASLDWSEEGAWKWKHPNIDFSLDLQTLLSPGEKQHEYHQLRESWRRRQFRDFLASGRRDAARLQGAQYQEDRMTLVRKTFRNSGTHARACMIGAVVSDARLARMQNPQAIPGPCQWCTSGEIPTWCHFLWDCSGFADTRCQKPPDLLLQTLGWPSGANTEVDTAVLLHMSTVRQRLLDRRYRGI